MKFYVQSLDGHKLVIDRESVAMAIHAFICKALQHYPELSGPIVHVSERGFTSHHVEDLYIPTGEIVNSIRTQDK